MKIFWADSWRRSFRNLSCRPVPLIFWFPAHKFPEKRPFAFSKTEFKSGIGTWFSWFGNFWCVQLPWVRFRGRQAPISVFSFHSQIQWRIPTSEKIVPRTCPSRFSITAFFGATTWTAFRFQTKAESFASGSSLPSPQARLPSCTWPSGWHSIPPAWSGLPEAVLWFDWNVHLTPMWWLPCGLDSSQPIACSFLSISSF